MAKGGWRLQLMKLMVAIAILMLLTGLAVPMARSADQAQKERELRAICARCGTQ